MPPFELSFRFEYPTVFISYSWLAPIKLLKFFDISDPIDIDFDDRLNCSTNPLLDIRCSV
jgi:hypothetical protein